MTLAAWQTTIKDEKGNVVPFADVEVRREADGAPIANIYEDRDGNTPLGNPTQADENGFIRIHAPGGVYRIDASKEGLSQTWRYQGIGLAQEQDSVAAGVAWRFDDATADADPGAGRWRLNDAVPENATEIYVSAIDADNAPQTGWLDTFDSGGSVANRGTLIIRQTDNAGLIVATVTGNITADASPVSYYKIPITVTAATEAGSFTAGSRNGFLFSINGAAAGQVNLDLGDDGSNESMSLAEIATLNDANGVFSHPVQDKLVIDLSKNWPKADEAPRNMFINGDFRFWRHGTSLLNETATGVHWLADRWFVSIADTVQFDYEQQEFTLGQTDVPGEPAYFARVTVDSSSGDDHEALLGQAVESVRTFAGRKCTISGYIKADGNKTVTVEPRQEFGSGGSPSSPVDVTGQDINVTTSWQEFELTFDIPSIAGKTLGTGDDPDDRLAFLFWMSAGANLSSRSNTGQQTGTFDFAMVQVEEGEVATPFEGGGEYTPGSRLVDTENVLRFASGVQIVWGTYTSNDSGSAARTSFPVSFDVPPVVLLQTERALSDLTTQQRFSVVGDITTDDFAAQSWDSGGGRSGVSGSYIAIGTWAAND